MQPLNSNHSWVKWISVKTLFWDPVQQVINAKQQIVSRMFFFFFFFFKKILITKINVFSTKPELGFNKLYCSLINEQTL